MYHSISFSLDGFEFIARDHLGSGLEQNIQKFRNELSPFVELPHSEPSLTKRELVIDAQYGQVFESWIEDARGIYGISDRMPKMAAHSFANMGFLRVPYRKIPRIAVSDRDTLQSLLISWRAVNPSDISMLVRGQTQEYLLERSARTMEVLYGDQSALEPSLASSASRAGIEIGPLMAEWLAVLDVLCWGRCAQEDQAELGRFSQSDNRLGLGLAMAQHYGLPSTGLDTTNSLDIALFFALHRFKDLGDGTCAWERVGPDDSPVLYVFMVPERFALVHAMLEPRSVWAGTRPDAQAAHYLPTGWGFSRNQCARQLFVALYLDPNGDYGPVPSVSAMFPQDDFFATFLLAIREQRVSRELAHYLARFKHVRTVQGDV